MPTPPKFKSSAKKKPKKPKSTRTGPGSPGLKIPKGRDMAKKNPRYVA